MKKKVLFILSALVSWQMAWSQDNGQQEDGQWFNAMCKMKLFTGYTNTINKGEIDVALRFKIIGDGEVQLGGGKTETAFAGNDTVPRYGGRGFITVVPETVVNEADGKTYTVTAIGKRAFVQKRTVDTVACEVRGAVTYAFILPETIEKIDSGAFDVGKIQLLEFNSALPPPDIADDAFGSGGFKSVGHEIIVPVMARGDYKKNKVLAGDNVDIYEKMTATCDIENGSEKSTIGIDVYCNSNNRAGWKIGTGLDITAVPLYTAGRITLPDFLQKVQEDEEGKKNAPVINRISDHAFAHCPNLEYVHFPDTLDRIDKGAFTNSGIKRFDFPVKWKKAEAGYLEGCTELEEVNFGKLIEKIEDKVFVGTKIRSINVAIENAKYTSVDQEGNPLNVVYETETKTVVKGCNTSTIPSNAATIGSHAFTLAQFEEDKRALTLPDSVTSIQDYAFYGTNLTTVGVETGSMLKKIENHAFAWAADLTAATFDHSQLESIGTGAFARDMELASFSAIGTQLKTIDSEAFLNCTSLANLDMKNFTTQLTSIGSNAFSGCTKFTKMDLSGQPLKTIGFAAFSCKFEIYDNNKSLVSPELTYKDVYGWNKSGGYTFSFGNKEYPCTNLEEIDLSFTPLKSLGVRAFYGCKKLKTVVMPDSLSTIGLATFYECKALENISIPASTKTIAEYAFAGSGLKTISIADDSQLTTIKHNAFDFCVDLTSFRATDHLKKISDYAFRGCKGLKTLDVSEKCPLQKIGDYAFESCEALESVVLPSTLQDFNYTMFLICPAITSFKIQGTGGTYFTKEGSCNLYKKLDGEKKVELAFHFDKVHKTVDLTEEATGINITSIGSDAFMQCQEVAESAVELVVTDNPKTRLEEWRSEIPNTTNIYDHVVLQTGHVPLKDENKDSEPEESLTITKVPVRIGGSKVTKEVKLPANLETISNRSFYFFEQLETIDIPASVTSIGDMAFNVCPSLRTVTFEERNSGELKFGVSSFENCDNLNFVGVNEEGSQFVFPEGTDTIPVAMFRACQHLNSVVIPATVKHIGNYAFEGCPFDGDSAEDDTKGYVYVLSTEPPTLGASVFGRNQYKITFVNGIPVSAKEIKYNKSGIEIRVPKTDDQQTTLNKYISAWGTAIGNTTITYKEIESQSSNQVNGALYLPVNTGRKTARITKLEADGNITIPESIDGYTVTSIADDALSTATNVQSIDLTEATSLYMNDASRESGLLSEVPASTLVYTPKGRTDLIGINIVNTDGDGNMSSQELNIAENATPDIKGEINVEDLTFERSFKAGEKATVFLPFALSAEQAASLGRFYAYTGYSEADNKVSFVSVTNGTKANTPYVFEATQDGSINMQEVTLVPRQASTGAFVGTYEPLSFDGTENAYGYAAQATGSIAAGSFVKFGDGASLKPYRAYLQLPGAATRAYRAVFDDNTTDGISTVGAQAATGEWHTLQGVKTTKPGRPGMYIVNGNKVVVK